MKTPSIPNTGDAGAAFAVAPKPVKVRLTRAQLEAAAEAKAAEDARRADRLNALGESLKTKRSAAISARQSLGIDQQWQEDLEFYEGIDDANRAEMTAMRTKPPGLTTAPAVMNEGEVRSNVFVNITRPYCDAAAARISDMLMPTDDRAFSIGPTPVPDLESMANGKLSRAVKQSLLDEIHDRTLSAEQMEALVAPKIANAIEKAKADMTEAKERADRAQKRVDDWFVECQFHGEARKVIDDCAKIGTGVIKGPVPVKRKSQKVVTENGEMVLVMEEKIAPGSRRIDPLNFFPHGACGENIHNGSYTWERDHLTRRTLQDLKGTPGYIDSAIDECIKEGPQKASTEAPEPQGSDTSVSSEDRFEIWYFYGMLDREDLEAMGCKCDELKETTKTVHAIVTMVNDRVIKGAINPLDNGAFPYDVMVWQRQAGRWTGCGVSRQIRTPQRMVNAGTRNMMDNAGLSAGPQIVMKLGVVEPADGNNNITPRKLWYVTSEAEITDLNAVFRTYNIDSKQTELMAIIQFGLKLAEDVTGLPLLLQGQGGKAPDTLGGMQMLNNNSSTVLRRLAKLYDDGITEPHVRRYYVWLMQYGEDNEKGDFQIDARGSSALVERDIQNQSVVQMGSIVLNPAFGIDPDKWFAEYCKSQRLDPKRFQFTEEQKKANAENAAKQGPTDPRVAVTQLRGEIEQKLAQFEQQAAERELMLTQQFESQENERDRNLQLMIADMEQSGQKTISFADLKARLASDAMKLRTQRDLSMASNAVTLRKSQTITPPTEPAGQAPAGQAYQR